MTPKGHHTSTGDRRISKNDDLLHIVYCPVYLERSDDKKKKKRKKKDCSRTKQPQLNLIITGYVKVRMEKPMQTQLMNKEN